MEFEIHINCCKFCKSLNYSNYWKDYGKAWECYLKAIPEDWWKQKDLADMEEMGKEND